MEAFQLDLFGEREDATSVTARLEAEGRAFFEAQGDDAAVRVLEQLRWASSPLSPLVIGLGLGWYGLPGCYAVLCACEQLERDGLARCVATSLGERWEAVAA